MDINAAKDYYNYVVNEIQIFAVENGDEGIMFNYKLDNESFEFVDIDENINYLERYVTDSMNVDTEITNLNAPEYKILLTIWFWSTFFESIMPSKVLLVAIWERGSRKTSTLRCLGIILFGSKYNASCIPSKPEDFDTIITSQLVIWDNVDTGKSWLNDKLAMVATGQNIEKRMLYTTNEMVKSPAKTYLLVTSRTPQFTRNDVADRIIGIYLAKVGGYIPENDVMVDVIDNSNEIMSYIILKLQKVLQAFQTTKERKYQTKFRIADFAILWLHIFDFLGKKEECERILEKVCTMQKEFAIEEDSLVYLLKIQAKKKIKPQKCSGFELHKMLLSLASEDNFDVLEFRAKYKTVKSLTRSICNIKSIVINNVKITVYKERANQKSYKIELVDKEFELPPTNNSLFENATD